MKQKKSAILSAFAGLFFLMPVMASLYYAGTLADQYYVRHGEMLQITAALPVSAETQAAGGITSDTALRLFGIFPIKTVEMHPTEEIMLIPGGEPFGLRMLMDGIMVIGFGEVEGSGGHSCPAVTAGLQEGDIIREIGHEPLTDTDTFREAVQKGEAMMLTVQRGEETPELTLTPDYSVTEECCLTG